MSLSVEELAILLGILEEENSEKLSFEALCFQLRHCFYEKDRFKIGNALVVLLQHADLLPRPAQRLAAITFLYDMYRGETLIGNPFAPVFVHLLQPHDGAAEPGVGSMPILSVAEKSFVTQLITDSNPGLMKMTANQILAAKGGSFLLDISGLEKALGEIQKELPPTARSGISVVLPDSDQGTSLPVDPIAPQRTAEVLVAGKPVPPISQTFKPQMIRLAPPLHECENELAWLNMTCFEDGKMEHMPVYDETACMWTSARVEAKKSMEKAVESPLTLQERQQLLEELQSFPKLVYHMDMTPDKLPGLVENNPLIAIEVLMKLLQSTKITDYFSVLVNMDMSLHSMEVLNRILITVDLPSEFVRLYISNCMHNCETIESRYMQDRLVRLVCVFLRSLIRNKIFLEQELLVQVQAFCIQFSRIREATALFRVIKQLEAGEEGVTGGASTSGDNQPGKP